MTANQRASTTMLWIKQLTTSTFSSINKKVDKIGFFYRNKKLLMLLFLAWCFLILGSHFIFNLLSTQLRDSFLKERANASEQLSTQCAPLLLEDDFLELNTHISEFAKGAGILFAAVLNHENKVVAHTDAEKFNQLFEYPKYPTHIKTIGEVEIETGQQPNGGIAVVFSRTITYSGVKIGSTVFGIPGKLLTGIDHRFKIYKISFFVVITLGALILAYTMMDRRQRAAPVKSIVEAKDGSKIGPYRLREKIAQGGMAELYIADYVRQDGFRRQVAIKKVLPHLVENQDFIKMFIREARLAALLQHPNIVQIFDFGNIQNTYIIAMEYIKGLNLGQVMAQLQTALPVDMAIFIMMKISLGLDYSHKRKDDETGQTLGIVHRDISPQNILISHQGEVKISDFGISKATTEPSLTQAGVIKGKLAYLAPEQALGRPVDHQADIYSLGLVFYEILTGARLYQFDSDIEAIRTIPEMVIPPVKSVRPDLPEELDRIVMRCLEKDKSRRYADALALHDDLMRVRIKHQISYDASDLSNFMRMKLNYA